jgi:Uncharacterised nucleotidyltransferase/Transglutaminase-like superfamily
MGHPDLLLPMKLRSKESGAELAACVSFQHTDAGAEPVKPGERVYSAEFDLVRACLRWPQEQVDGERIRSLAAQPLRWQQLRAIVEHHKVVPLFSRNLETFAAGYMPEEHAAALRRESVANAHQCLRLTGQLFSLNRVFRERQIDLRIFKGIPLALAAFQDPTLRDAGDIDLLVAEKDIFTAGEILRAEGYLRTEPQARLTPRRLRSYLAHQKDFSYEQPGTGILIDLHWRLFRNSFLPANAGIDQAGEAWINLGSESIPTLPPPQLLLYLCVHGALDGWLRLKWLADIGALLHTMTPEQVASAAALARRQQALPQFSAAILLCQEMLGPHPMPDGCLDREDRRVAHIICFGKRLLTSNEYRPMREKIASPRWFLNEFRLHTSLRYRLDMIERSLFRPRIWRRFDLPDALFPLYALMSPLEWLTFHVHRRLARVWFTRMPLRRMMQLPPADIALAIEAGCMLTFFRIALNFLPVQKLTAWMGRPVQLVPAQENAGQTLRRVKWSIDAVIRHVPLTFVCFPQCLAAYFMLRRRHIASRLFYGVARDADQLKAHTWVKVGDRTVVGGEVESRFTVLTTFP